MASCIQIGVCKGWLSRAIRIARHQHTSVEIQIPTSLPQSHPVNGNFPMRCWSFSRTCAAQQRAIESHLRMQVTFFCHATWRTFSSGINRCGEATETLKRPGGRDQLEVPEKLGHSLIRDFYKPRISQKRLGFADQYLTMLYAQKVYIHYVIQLTAVKHPKKF